MEQYGWFTPGCNIQWTTEIYPSDIQEILLSPPSPPEDEDDEVEEEGDEEYESEVETDEDEEDY